MGAAFAVDSVAGLALSRRSSDQFLRRLTKCQSIQWLSAMESALKKTKMSTDLRDASGIIQADVLSRKGRIVNVEPLESRNTRSPKLTKNKLFHQECRIEALLGI